MAYFKISWEIDPDPDIDDDGKRHKWIRGGMKDALKFSREQQDFSFAAGEKHGTGGQIVIPTMTIEGPKDKIEIRREIKSNA